MKNTILFIAGLLLFQVKAFAAPVEIKVKGVKSTAGSIFISIFGNAQAWDKEKPTATLQIKPVSKGTSKITADFPPGEYAFFLYHDVDNNGQLQTNVFGFPTEPYAFSNNFKLSMSKPTWAQLKFSVSDKGTIHAVDLN